MALRRAVLEAVSAVAPDPLLATAEELAIALKAPAEEVIAAVTALRTHGLLRVCTTCRRTPLDCAQTAPSVPSLSGELYFCLTARGRQVLASCNSDALSSTPCVAVPFPPSSSPPSSRPSLKRRPDPKSPA